MEIVSIMNQGSGSFFTLAFTLPELEEANVTRALAISMALH